MRAYKQFTTKDVTRTAFNVSRLFSFNGNESTGSDVGIEYYQGECPPSDLIFISESATWSGMNYPEPNVCVYSNIKHLYYSNYLSSSYGDLAVTQSILPGANSEFQNQAPYGGIPAPRNENYLQSTLTQSRYFPTASGDKISVISIPARVYGENIMPDTFNLTYTSSTGARYGIDDDGQGNLLTGSQIIGQIFYPHGIVVFTSGGLVSASNDVQIPNTKFLPQLNVSYSSSFRIYEHQYKCTINENEFTYTLNPTTLSGLGSINTTPNSLVSSITVNTADAANSVFTGVTASVISASGDPSTGTGLEMTITTLGVDGLSSVQGIEVTNRGYGYNIGDILTISSGQITGTTDVKIVLQQSNFWIENKNGDIYYDWATGSYFTPYLTTVGLYNDNNDLLAVGKLSTPTPISKFVDTNIYVNFDI